MDKVTKAEELYKEDCFYDYQPIIDSFGEVVLQKDKEDYQGDSFVVLKNNAKYGFLTFGWGSCSGCDALQACNTFSEVDELIESLYNSITWFDNLNDLKDYVKKRDSDWYTYDDTFKEFKELLNNLN